LSYLWRAGDKDVDVSGSVVVRLDRPVMANVFRSDPDATLLERGESVLLEECRTFRESWNR